MEDYNCSESIYDLTTKLCEKFLNPKHKSISVKTVKKLRSKAFEILLSKKLSENDDQICLENNNDPFCHLLAWQYVLINEYDLPEHATKLQKCVDKLQKSSNLSEATLKDLLYIFLKLRRFPEHSHILPASCTFIQQSSSHFRHFDESKFKLPVAIICSDSKFNNDSFCLKPKRNFKRTLSGRTVYFNKDFCSECAMLPSQISCKSSQTTIKDDEGYESPTKDNFDIWDVVTSSKFTDHRTWEAISNPSPEKELPFMTESPSNICAKTYYLINLQKQLLNSDTNCNMEKTISQKQFIHNIKFLLVGVSSDSFVFNNKGELAFVSGIYVEGITSLAMESYCKDFIYCGSCYKALNDMCNPTPATSKNNQHQGFIFRELCESIKRYLLYYRVAALSISDNSNLLSVHNSTRQLHAHLEVLASVCKVGPFTETGELPNGVALLNYLYQKVTSLSNKDVIMVLYSVFYPCVQVYFSRFLQQWIFEGVVNDPYNEFFVYPTQKYINTRGRTYWTRSYKVQEDVVPDFLSELCNDILACGKSMNLLKLCVPQSSLCVYLMGKKPSLLSCCLTSEQLVNLEHNASCYYMEVVADCGQRFSFSDIVTRSYEQHIIFTNLITKKRAATIKRLELEKLKKIQDESERKQKQIAKLKLQYDEALQQKKVQLIQEIEREMKLNEANLKMQNLREKLIQEEAHNLIEYYNNLSEIAEQRRISIEKHIKRLKNIHLEDDAYDKNVQESNTSSEVCLEDVENVDTSSSDTYLSLSCETSKKNDTATEDDSPKEMHSAQSLDIINANSDIFGDGNDNNENKQLSCDASDDVQMFEVDSLAAENFEIARKNRAKVMSVEMGVEVKADVKKPTKNNKSNEGLSELQRNRLRVLSSEFGLAIKMDSNVTSEKELTALQINRRKIMGSDIGLKAEIDNFIGKKCISQLEKNKCKMMESNECFYEEGPLIITKCDNENFINCNVSIDNKNYLENKKNEENGNIKITEEFLINEQKKNEIFEKTTNLKLDFSKITYKETVQNETSIFTKFLKSPNFELEKPTPMSIDSTPCTDIPSATPKMLMSMEKEQFDSFTSLVTTAATNFTDEGFNFNAVEFKTEPIFSMKSYDENFVQKGMISKRLSGSDVMGVSTSCLKLFLQESVSIPIKTQTKLVNNELLRYFINGSQYLMHINSLRNYFFLLDGEFGRNITEGLFEKLYDVNFPVDLINCRTLQHLVYHAMDSSIKLQENANCLSFKINNLPKTFDLGDPDVLECLSLTYKITWPLNILLPSDTIGKYDEVFKYLLKLHRVSWVLKKIFQELKILAKQTGKKEPFLMLSPQFQKLHQCRHVMTHFIQTLQNYIVGEVLQTSWDTFEKKLTAVSNLDQLYSLHTMYIKNILFMCLLNQKSAPIRKIIHKIFVIILKFYDYLRIKKWEYDDDDGVYTHPNFNKLEDIFLNFEEFVVYLFKAGHKVAKVGYQPHLIQLLDMLNINDYYTKRNVAYSASESH